MTERTLVVMPCSGAKARGAFPAAPPGRSVLDDLAGARAALARGRAHHAGAIDAASPPCRAIDRYCGRLYQTPRLAEAIHTARAAGWAETVILSGAYGCLYPDEPIHWYDAPLRAKPWLADQLPAVLAELTIRGGFATVVAFLAASTDYAVIVRAVDWAGIGRAAALRSVSLCSPVCGPAAGAQARVPQALGAAIAAFLDAPSPGPSFKEVLAAQPGGLRWAVHDLLGRSAPR